MAGAPSEYLEIEGKIRRLVLSGEYFANIQKELHIPAGTWDYWYWDNYQGFRDKLDNWKRDRMLKLAEQNLEGILCLGISDKESMKVVQDTAKFVAETLGKTNYAKRNELTGKNGDNLIPEPLLGGQSNGDKSNDSDSQVAQTE